MLWGWIEAAVWSFEPTANGILSAGVDVEFAVLRQMEAGRAGDVEAASQAYRCLWRSWDCSAL